MQHVAKTGTISSTYGVINGISNIVSSLMPMFMGTAMTSHSSENLAAGFWLLVGSQFLTAIAGLTLAWRLGRANAPVAGGIVGSLNVSKNGSIRFRTGPLTIRISRTVSVAQLFGEDSNGTARTRVLVAL